MRSIIVLALLVAIASAGDYNQGYGKQTNGNYYSACFGGQLLPSYSENGPCQIDSECFKGCFATCRGANYELVSSALCLQQKPKQKKQQYGYGYQQQKSQKGYNVKKQCHCCCTNFPTCTYGTLAIGSGNPVYTSCQGTLNQCSTFCFGKNSPCLGSQNTYGQNTYVQNAYAQNTYAQNAYAPITGRPTNENYCIFQQTTSGSTGTCACCCDYTQPQNNGQCSSCPLINGRQPQLLVVVGPTTGSLLTICVGYPPNSPPKMGKRAPGDDLTKVDTTKVDTTKVDTTEGMKDPGPKAPMPGTSCVYLNGKLVLDVAGLLDDLGMDSSAAMTIGPNSEVNRQCPLTCPGASNSYSGSGIYQF